MGIAATHVTVLGRHVQALIYALMMIFCHLDNLLHQQQCKGLGSIYASFHYESVFNIFTAIPPIRKISECLIS